ncbi:MAG: DUF2971 domain-containing protein, partial [Treponema sp.]|nr:DUF2971 domain-containing protein [Treponema sp.]
MKLKIQLTDNTFSYDSLLYHYTSEESAHKILTNNTLKLSSLPKTNDPLEFEDLSMIMFNREIRERGLKFKYLQDSFTERKNTVRFACFSIDSQCIKNDDVSSQSYTGDLFFKGWARNRMWAQYADNHAGVCLVFDKNEFKNCFDVLANNSTEVLEDQKIKYTNDFSSYEKAMSNIEKEMNSKIDYRNFYLDGERRKFLFQKCEDFRDENEYRF